MDDRMEDFSIHELFNWDGTPSGYARVEALIDGRRFGAFVFPEMKGAVEDEAFAKSYLLNLYDQAETQTP